MPWPWMVMDGMGYEKSKMFVDQLPPSLRYVFSVLEQVKI